MCLCLLSLLSLLLSWRMPLAQTMLLIVRHHSLANSIFCILYLYLCSAIATSVGSKTLTIRQAIVMAGFCEFSGAAIMGAKVTDTISKGTEEGMESHMAEILTLR